jgi:RNA polymerase sigma factor (sigma-70 family)
MMAEMSLEELARTALDGGQDALDRLVRALQGDVSGLALRMLWNREDAEDATQEILVRTVTRLSQFDFRSKLKTWVYRIAVNYILDLKRSPVERMKLTFERFAADLADGLSSDGSTDGERSLLVEEVKVGCTLGMLQCLDRPHRLPTSWSSFSTSPDPKLPTPSRSPPSSCASVYSMRGRRSSRSRAPTAALHQTAPPAAVIVVSLRQCAQGESGRTCSTSLSGQRLSETPARSFVKSSTRGGRCRSIARALLAPRRLTLSAASLEQSTRQDGLDPNRDDSRAFN